MFLQEFEAIFEFPHVEAALIWGDPAVGHVTIDDVHDAFTRSDGLKALIARVGKAKCDCAKSMCSGHGRCYGVGSETAPGGYSACECFEGYSGTNCTQADDAQVLDADVAVEDKAVATLAGNVTCPDGVSFCPAGSTCGQHYSGRWGCCPLSEAVLCGDALHCCPSGTECDSSAGVCYQ